MLRDASIQHWPLMAHSLLTINVPQSSVFIPLSFLLLQP